MSRRSSRPVYPELSLEPRRKKQAKQLDARRQNNSKLCPVNMELIELSGLSCVHVKSCLSGPSSSRIRQHSGHVSATSTCNIKVICDGWSGCYKCMFPRRGLACMLHEQDRESHMTACVAVSYLVHASQPWRCSFAS